MSSSKKIAIETFNLTQNFDELTAVNNVSFRIYEGEIVGILGPNGAGKTTTIRLITGLFQLENTSKVEIYSKDFTSNSKEAKRNFGIVPEVSNAYSDFTVWQNLKFSGSIYGISQTELKKRIMTLLERFELMNKIHSKTKSLSKGLKQRLNLCLALLHEPPILILDEPTSGLDPSSAKIVRDQILEFKREGKTILITTHNMQEAQQVCDRIFIMNQGKIIADESPDNLRKKFKPTSTLLFTIEGKLSLEQKTELESRFNLIEEQKDRFSIISNNPLEDISNLNDFSKQHEIKISTFRLTETSLEEVFIHLIENDVKSYRGDDV